MCVCTYINQCVHMYIYIHIHMYTCTICVCVCSYMCVYEYMCLSLSIYIYSCVYICIYIYIYIMYAYMHACMHACMYVFSFLAKRPPTTCMKVTGPAMGYWGSYGNGNVNLGRLMSCLPGPNPVPDGLQPLSSSQKGGDNPSAGACNQAWHSIQVHRELQPWVLPVNRDPSDGLGSCP